MCFFFPPHLLFETFIVAMIFRVMLEMSAEHKQNMESDKIYSTNKIFNSDWSS
jgi:hypothetical protein